MDLHNSRISHDLSTQMFAYVSMNLKIPYKVILLIAGFYLKLTADLLFKLVFLDPRNQGFMKYSVRCPFVQSFSLEPLVGIFWTFEIGMLSNFKSDPVGFFEKNHVQGCLGQKCPKWGKKTCSTKNPFCCQFIVLETNQLKLAKNIPFLLSPKIGISQYHWDIWRNFS